MEFHKGDDTNESLAEYATLLADPVAARILSRLSGGPLPTGDIWKGESAYRLTRMERAGLVTNADGTVTLSNSGRRVAGMVR